MMDWWISGGRRGREWAEGHREMRSDLSHLVGFGEVEFGTGLVEIGRGKKRRKGETPSAGGVKS